MKHNCATDDRKLAIDRPCSACNAGDSKMGYHDHCPPFRAAPAPQAEGTCPELSHALETLKSVRTRLVEKVGNLQKELESLTDVIDSIEGKP